MSDINEDKSRLLALLSQEAAWESAGLESVRDYEVTSGVPARDLLQIYSRRARRRPTRRVFEGFADLLQALEKEEQDTPVRVHLFKRDDEHWFVFTNAEITRLVAVLKSVSRIVEPLIEYGEDGR